MSPPAVEHPPAEKLSAFLLGSMETVERDSVEGHILNCAECCSRLSKIADDDLVRLVNKVGTVWNDGDTHEDTNGSAAVDSDEIPQQLLAHERYRVRSRIGRGGMGTVYKAEHRMMERTVALKVINPRFVNNPEAAERFHREIKAAARLTHPNIVTAHDAEQVDGLHLLVMEFVDGISLERQVRRRGSLPVKAAIRFVRQAAHALQHAHQQGMVHRDIKPENLMLTRDGRKIKILDFGLARFAREEEETSDRTDHSETPTGAGTLTRSDTVLGTPDYMAPEQIGDAGSADIRADIYSLGCTLYFLLTGQPPFSGETIRDKLAAHQNSKLPPLHTLREDVPCELTEIAARMTAKDPADRYQTPQEVVDALGQFLDTGITTVGAESPTVAVDKSDSSTHQETAVPNAKWQRYVWPVILSGLVLTYAVFSFVTARPDPPRVLYVLPPRDMNMSDYDSRAMLDVAGVEVTTACYLEHVLRARRGSRRFDPEITADVLLDHVDAAQFDAVVFVGVGMWQFWAWEGQARKPAQDSTGKIIAAFESEGKPVVCITESMVRLVGTQREAMPPEQQFQDFHQKQEAIWSDADFDIRPSEFDDGLIVAGISGDGRRLLHELLRKLERGAK